MKQLGLLIDISRCIGCKTCIVACQNHHELVDYKNAIPDQIPSYLSVQSKREGTYPHICVDTWVMPCQHCNKPPCMSVCKAGAIVKDKQSGIVRIDKEKCDGDGACIKKCPYNVIQFNTKENFAHKCNLCEERVLMGDKPVCADVCLADAITFGEKQILASIAEAKGMAIVKKMSLNAIIYAKSR